MWNGSSVLFNNSNIEANLTSNGTACFIGIASGATLDINDSVMQIYMSENSSSAYMILNDSDADITISNSWVCFSGLNTLAMCKNCSILMNNVTGC